MPFRAGFVPADHGPLGFVGPGVDLQHVFRFAAVLAEGSPMHPDFTRRGLSLFFEQLTHGHVADVLNVTEFDHLIGQQP